MIKGMLHVAISVDDMEKSTDFYTRVMGMEVEVRVPYRGEVPGRIVGIPGAEFEMCLLCKGASRIELLAYKAKPDSRGYRPQNETGVVHVAFEVDDVKKEHERISALGYRFYSSPMQGRPGANTVCYFEGPDNVVIELSELAAGGAHAGRAVVSS